MSNVLPPPYVRILTASVGALALVWGVGVKPAPWQGRSADTWYVLSGLRRWPKRRHPALKYTWTCVVRMSSDTGGRLPDWIPRNLFHESIVTGWPTEALAVCRKVAAAAGRLLQQQETVVDGREAGIRAVIFLRGSDHVWLPHRWQASHRAYDLASC